MIKIVRLIILIVLVIAGIFLIIPVINIGAAIHQESSISKKFFTVEKNEFGLITDSLLSSEKVAGKNDNIKKILLKSGLPEEVAAKAAAEGKEFFRGFTGGDIYHIFANSYDPEELLYLVFEKDPINYVIIDLTDSVEVYPGQKEFTRKRKSVEGVIKTSFYHSLRGNDLHPELIEKLSEIYQWQIDFYRLTKGDHFRFIIEEKYAGDTLAGDPEIAAAYFSHGGESFYAIRFDDGKDVGYYDLTGRNVKRSFLKAPVEYSSVSSPYADTRFHPILKVKKAHLGTDYAAPHGTPIHSVADGVIADAAFTRGNGKYVRVVHNEVYSTQYLHMSAFAKNIKPGKRVRQGEIIGYVGSTGLATGPHVCFRFWKNGVQVNPANEQMASNYTLEGYDLFDFLERRDSLLSDLGIKIYSEEMAVSQ